MENSDRLPDIQIYLDSGLDLILLNNRDKSPYLKGWRTQSCTFERIKTHVLGGGNVGWRIGKQDLVIDVDPRNFPEGKDSLEELIRDFKLTDFLENCPTILTGSGGTHFYCSLPIAVSLTNVLVDPETKKDKYKGVEFKSYGRQVVTSGSIHPNGTLYAFDVFTAELSNRPTVPNDLLSQLVKPETTPTPSINRSVESVITPQQLETLLSLLDIEDYREHSDWLNLMMASHHGTGGSGREEFIQWSISDPKYRSHRRVIANRWDSFKATDYAITIATLYRYIINAEKQIPAFVEFDEVSELEILTEEDRLIERINQDWCIVFGVGAGHVYHRQYVEPNSMGLSWVKHSLKEFQIYFMNKPEPLNGEMVDVGKWWLINRRRREAKGFTFNPNYIGRQYLNFWEGFSIIPEQGEWPLLYHLISDVICNGNLEHTEYFLNWVAFLFQHPEKQSEVAMVIRGSKGVGKGTIGTAIMRIIETHAHQVSSTDQFVGRFNAHLRNCAFLFVDEAFWAGSHTGESSLKRLITEPTIFFEGKGVDGYTGPNALSVMIASNSDWVVPASLGRERRFCVFNMSDARFGDRIFWNGLYKEMAEGGLAAFHHDLQDRDLTDWHPRQDVPQTEALSEQKKESMDNFAKWWLGCLTDGIIIGTNGVVAVTAEKWNKQNVFVTLDDIYQSCRNDFLTRNVRQQIRTKQQFQEWLTKFNVVEGKFRKEKGMVLELKQLGECRNAFDKAVGFPQPWEDEQL